MDYWQHQTNEPLFPDVIWSRPETRLGSGKLLIVGGSPGNMSHVSTSYTRAERASSGTIRLMVPDSLSKVTKGIPHIEYAPSTPSGSFSRSALAICLDATAAVDGVIFAGDLGKNSETGIFLESFANSHNGILAISSDAVDSFPLPHRNLLDIQSSVIHMSLNQLRSMVIELELEQAVTSDIARKQLAEILHEISTRHTALIMVEHQETVWATKDGQVIDSLCENFDFIKAVVWLIQQPKKPLQAVVSSQI